MSDLITHARAELAKAGLLDKDSDYNGMLGEAALELVEKFAGQGHSGVSAAMTIDLVSRLMRYEPLTALTNDPTEWNHVANDMAGRPDLWQSRRDPAAFSNDGGKTYKRNGEDETHTSVAH
ncbi:hypothetical protein [Terrabacter sp. C0L_2]|uniref:hypothetical protein n=1 Tax=Terrabacter sp. C0L_2 TaxID=3108389 RepID=UPI002ED20D34|nr:hypothetical protein U5C87_17585 [Terrabacter sp. C0L_2]